MCNPPARELDQPVEPAFRDGLHALFRSLRLLLGLEISLDGAEAGLLGNEQALQVLAIIDETLGTNHTCGVEQDGIGELADVESHPHLRRVHVGNALEAELADHRALFGIVAVAYQHYIEPLGVRERAGDGE